ncbi:MAG: helix-hairpin-helix domain-containing protein [Gammaproteobacteria bacterium]|nr:helix-hairpin-helix domain-containing protein [Gammaproteobacteria bacterium]MCI0591453.1 helix-hairpin-helix domain-containing protein [Gammaproteobacteria bacterium]
MSSVGRLILALFLVLSLPLTVLSDELVNINTADAKTLASAMKGVGPVKAEAIVAYREQHGPFMSVEDLTLVDGIGEQTVDMNRDILTVGKPGGDEGY